jgi:hypothetical protein
MATKRRITVSRIYDCDAEEIINRIKQGELFRLTGADFISNTQFKEGEAFLLRFGERGSISGKIERSSATEIYLSWNVDGFDREPERDTEVHITVHRNEKLRLDLNHLNIASDESAAAKRKAWEEILYNLDGTHTQG